MSRSNSDLETQLVTPCKKFFKWSSQNKMFEFYDKETKKNIPQPIPFTFIVLDSLVAVGGFSDSEQAGYYSNEVRDMMKDPFAVRLGKKGVVCTGLYNDKIKGHAEMEFVQSVYIAYKEGDKMEIGNIHFRGASVGAFFEFKKANDLMKIAVNVSSTVEGKKGSVTFNMPVFKALPLSDASDASATALDVILQEYLVKYFKKQKEYFANGAQEEVIATTPAVAAPVVSENEKALFPNGQGAVQTNTVAAPVKQEIAADDLPF